ncbi:GNAT family N-acetyltransferase [Thalassobacillus hwangdonensis]|uniref:Enhanced intracellular survival protein Eis n=1 Tax=Thalassobacillus hwangdonensis TaxID=546108 RepID=A0ABW3KWX1_9BACI
MTIIKSAVKEDYDAILELGEYAFNYKLTDEQKSDRHWQMDQQKVFIIKDDKTIASKLHLLPLEVFFGEKKIKMGGIAGVATWPEYRRLGHVGEMMKHSLQTMKECGMNFSMLHPFSIPFYRKYGYELTNYQHTYEYDITKLTMQGKHIPGKVKRFKAEHFESCKSELQRLYSRKAEHYTLLLEREDWWWEKRVLSPSSQMVLYFDDQGIAQGYMIAEMEKELLNIEEFIYFSSDAFHKLLQWVSQHDSMTGQVKLMMLPDDLDAYYFADPRGKESSHAYFMSRIVDVASFISEYPFINEGMDATFYLNVTDDHAHWNEGTWKWEVKEGNTVNFERVATEAEVPSISCTINTLTAILTGALTIEKAVFMHSLNGDEAQLSRLGALIQPKPPAFLDFF